VLDALEPALVAGLVVEDEVDRFRFSHALVRDAVLAAVPLSRRPGCTPGRGRCSTSPPRRPRPHRVDPHRGRPHWLAAGTGARQAGPGAPPPQRQVALGTARRRGGVRPAARRSRRPGGGRGVGLDGPLRPAADLIDACRWVPDWDRLSAAVDEAVEVADRPGTSSAPPRRPCSPAWCPVAAAVAWASCTSRRARAAPGAGRLPAGDGVLALPGAGRPRAGALLPRGSAGAGRRLTDEALAMARRIGDPALLQGALQAGSPPSGGRDGQPPAGADGGGGRPGRGHRGRASERPRSPCRPSCWVSSAASTACTRCSEQARALPSGCACRTSCSRSAA
jgi:hypothetical protein